MATPFLRRALPWVLRALLSLGFLVPGLTKFSPQAGWVERFAGWGYAAWFVTVIGSLETLGAIGLWVPRTRPYAVALLAIIMLGAVYTNLTHPPISDALRPLVFLALLAGLSWAQRGPGAT
jgi:uncharacterized membrane protein YphA (DoxX/SURF4 family)